MSLCDSPRLCLTFVSSVVPAPRLPSRTMACSILSGLLNGRNGPIRHLACPFSADAFGHAFTITVQFFRQIFPLLRSPRCLRASRVAVYNCIIHIVAWRSVRGSAGPIINSFPSDISMSEQANATAYTSATNTLDASPNRATASSLHLGVPPSPLCSCRHTAGTCKLSNNVTAL